MRHLLRTLIDTTMKYLYKCFYRIISVDSNTVLFLSFHGRGFLDNPRAIYEYLYTHDEFAELKFIWALHDTSIEIPGAKIIRYNSLSFFYWLAKSKYWIFNCKTYPYMLKKNNQCYLQTWHGTPLKCLGHDIEIGENAKFYRSGLSAKKMRSTYDDDVAKYNYMISPNAFCSEVFTHAFRVDKEKLIETGYPRNDVLFDVNQKKVHDIRMKLGIPKTKKVILYAPTWRDNSYNAAGYTFKLKIDFLKWKSILGDDYVVVFKPHYLIINDLEKDERLDGFLFRMNANADINELYLIADILVTDYSSVFFDYAVFNRPIYFYMYDVQEYKEELRGFYLDIYTDLPGEVIVSETLLLDKIKKNEYDYTRLKAFNERFNNHQDGHCAQRVCTIVFKDYLNEHGIQN